MSDDIFAQHLQGCWDEVIYPAENMVSRVWCFSGSTHGTVVGVFSAPTEGWDETYDYQIQNNKLAVDSLEECDALVVPKTKLTLYNCIKGDGVEGATYTFAEPQPDY